MKKVNPNKLLKNGRGLFLAYDQGLEHGPIEFNDKNVDPKYIIDIAKKGKFQGMIFQKGIAEKYQKEIKDSRIPLIVKLNGKTNLYKGEPISPVICTVKEAIKLGAVAVGFTIYIGSKHEEEMIEEFEEARKKAHKAGLPIIAWIYPRGKSVKNPKSKKMIAYAARVGLELGADIVKINYAGNEKGTEWAVKSAGKTIVLIAGGNKTGEKEFLKQVKEVMKSGASGLVIGRNIWKHQKPVELTKKIKKIIFK
jgi:class I fructose-bisphosphate aldolase|tara:strand:- start:2471 stop:3226 length:756 start_codon:yes stop_codon:yes gene_type:complete